MSLAISFKPGACAPDVDLETIHRSRWIVDYSLTECMYYTMEFFACQVKFICILCDFGGKNIHTIQGKKV